MGESFMTGAEYRVSSQKEQLLQAALKNLIDQKWRATLKNDEITILVEAEIVISAVVRHENRIETGHLTLDDVYYELQNDTNFRLFFSLVQYRGFEEYPRSLNFRFDSYWWMFRRYPEI
ncbi:MAG: hypothetical protein ACYDEJ_07540 [Desulfitobacteriaceae bacterium]